MRAVKPLLSALALAGLSVASTASFAADVYTSSASFLAQLAPGAYTESFTGLVDPSSGSFSSGVFTFNASASGGLYVSAGFLGTNQIDEPLSVSFTSGNVRGFGANFYATNISDEFQSVSVTVTLSDGTSTTFLPTTAADSFRGYTSSVPIASFTISAPGQSLYAGLDNLTVGNTVASTIPEPASLVLMGAGVMALLARRRKAPATC